MTGLALCGLAMLAALGWGAARPAAVVAHARVLLLAVAALSLVAAAGLFGLAPPELRVRLDPSSDPLLPIGDPLGAAYRQAVLDFGDDELYVVALETNDVFTAENLRAVRRLSRAIQQLPGVRSVENILNTHSFRNDAATDTLRIRPLVEEIPTDTASLARLRARALADPLWAGTLVSADGRTTALNVRFRDWTDLERIEAGTDDAIRAAAAAEATATRRFYFAGRPHVRDAAYHVMLRDLRTLMPLAIVVMAALLWLVSGSLRGVALPLATVGVGTLWTFGAVGWLGVKLNVVTIVLGPILIAVGSVYGVHVLAQVESAPRHDPADVARWLVERTRRPVLIAGVTTAAGFGALLLTDVPATRELGAFAAFGVIAVALLSLTALPATVARLPRTRGPAPRRARWLAARLDSALGRAADLASRRPTAVIVLWALLCALAAASLPRIAVDTDYLSFFAPDSRLRRDFDAVNRKLAGVVPLYAVLAGEGDGAFREPAQLRVLERAQQRIDAVAGVTASLSLVDLLRGGSRSVAPDPARRAAPALHRRSESREPADPHRRARLGAGSGAGRTAAPRAGRDGSGRVGCDPDRGHAAR